MTDPHPNPFEGLTRLEVLRALAFWLGWGFGPVAALIVAVRVLQAQFPSTDTALLLVAVVIPEAALLYAFILWRRRNRA